MHVGKLSAVGANPYIPAFSEKALDKHWGSGAKSDHSVQYPELTKGQYAERALSLARSVTSDNILGYRAEDDSIVRYDKITNDWTRAFHNTGVATLFKPTRGEAYYNENMIEDGGVTDD